MLYFFLTLGDDYSRSVWVYLLCAKTEDKKDFSSFFGMVKRQFETTIQIMRCDNGTEFRCRLDYFDQSGILFQTSCTGTLNKTVRLSVNIVTFLMLLVLYCFKQTFLFLSGVNVFLQLSISFMALILVC